MAQYKSSPHYKCLNIFCWREFHIFTEIADAAFMQELGKYAFGGDTPPRKNSEEKP